MSKARIAVVGAGRMGIGIAHVFAYAGHRVELIDCKHRTEAESQRVLKEAAGQIENNLQFLSSLELFDSSVLESIISRISYHQSAELEFILPEADVVFEAVPEILNAKEQTFARIGACTDKSTIVASTTSTFLVDQLASFVDCPERFLNTHWLNPAYLIPLVEVSAGERTTCDITDRMIALLESVGKMPVKCAASPGFIVPRIQALAMNEAARLVEEGVASPEDIDKASKVGFGLRFAILGLLEFIDWGGGDILYYAGNYLQDTLSSDRYGPPAIIAENMKTGHTGLKAGRGFYNFADRDVPAYHKETMKKFVDLLQHMGYFHPPGEPITPSST
jgi:3-hydroxybutyryl-CoA dehydrogenase